MLTRGKNKLHSQNVFMRNKQAEFLWKPTKNMESKFINLSENIYFIGGYVNILRATFS